MNTLTREHFEKETSWRILLVYYFCVLKSVCLSLFPAHACLVTCSTYQSSDTYCHNPTKQKLNLTRLRLDIIIKPNPPYTNYPS